jgi:MOSC domain-containing protein YiiM
MDVFLSEPVVIREKLSVAHNAATMRWYVETAFCGRVANLTHRVDILVAAQWTNSHNVRIRIRPLLRAAGSFVRVISLNVGRPRRVETGGGSVVTSIWKSPVEGKVPVIGHNIQGDRQSDLRVHGGPYKAIYLYPFEHYEYWSRELPGFELTYGGFGENLTTQGFTEDRVHIGDQFRVGSAILKITQPRMPCFKLGIRFGRADMVRRFWASGRSGIYFSVVEEGEIEAGDSIEQVASDPNGVSIADVVRLFKREVRDEGLLNRALKSPLRGSWKKDIQSRLLEEELEES